MELKLITVSRVLPAVLTAIKDEIRTVTNAFPGAISDALKTMPTQLEKGLAPIIQRSVTGVVQSSASIASIFVRLSLP